MKIDRDIVDGAREELTRLLAAHSSTPETQVEANVTERALANFQEINSWVKSNPKLGEYLSHIRGYADHNALVLTPPKFRIPFLSLPWGTLGLTDRGVCFRSQDSASIDIWPTLTESELQDPKGDMHIVVDHLAGLRRTAVLHNILKSIN